MNITFIDITSFRGISSEAEHFYAKIARPENAADMVAFDIGTSFDTCARDYSGINLRFFPTEEQARKYAKKDYPDYLKKTIGEEELNRRRKWCIEDLLEDGTIRFPSINDIIRTARDKYPDSLLYFTYHGSHKEFCKRFCFDKDERINHEMSIPSMNCNEAAKAHHNHVTDVDESRAMINAGRDIYTAQWYWEKSGFPADCPWYLHPVPMADRQLQMDEYDRFFKVNHADVARGRIIPAWSK